MSDKTLGKEGFADQFFAVCSLPSAALGKGFTECNLAFAECLRHSAKNLNPVVQVVNLQIPSCLLLRAASVAAGSQEVVGAQQDVQRR